MVTAWQRLSGGTRMTITIELQDIRKLDIKLQQQNLRQREPLYESYSKSYTGEYFGVTNVTVAYREYWKTGELQQFERDRTVWERYDIGLNYGGENYGDETIK